MADLTGHSFVLVHGAWHGGWCWRDVAARLRARGGSVFTPTMTGLGERAHLRAAYAGLRTFIQDVVAVIATEELSRVTLVGHSFGGIVATAVADALPVAVSCLVYLDAGVGFDGHSFVDGPDATPATVAATMAGLKALTTDGEWMAPVPLDVLGLAGEPEVLRAHIARRLTPNPLSSWTEPLRLPNGGPRCPRTYIWCNRPAMQASFPKHYENVVAGRYGPGWTAHTLPTGHEAMLTMPGKTAELIAQAALS